MQITHLVFLATALVCFLTSVSFLGHRGNFGSRTSRQDTLVQRVCDASGLALSPPVCYQGTPPRYLPNIFGGPATLGQCNFGHPIPTSGIFGACWSGALFAFSGVDGPTDTFGLNGWFVNGSYSVHLALHTPRLLRLGFGKKAVAEPLVDNVLVATNDVLLVEQGLGNRLAVTWSSTKLIVGIVQGSASVALEELVNGSIAVVNVSQTAEDVLALATASATNTADGTNFALCYALNAPEAVACARAALVGLDVGITIAARNRYILELPPLADPSDDRFQRKLLSVMKVNSLSAEGAIAQGWSSTCRAPHKFMYLWDAMSQTLAMNHVDPDLALEYIETFLQFQNPETGLLCSGIGPPNGCLGTDPNGTSTGSTAAMSPNVALTLWDNYLQKPNRSVLTAMFPKLERYIQWDLQNRRKNSSESPYLLWWLQSGEAGMDHEQNFCPGDSHWAGGCTHNGDHFSVDFTCYIIMECQALATIATELGLHERAVYWNGLAANTTAALNQYMWDEPTGFYYDRYFNGTLSNIKSVAGFYPLLADGMPTDRVRRLVHMLKSSEFNTAVPIPIVATSTLDFSTDLDRGNMWTRQNFYVIRGLRKYGYNQEADELKAATLGVVRRYYERWGVVFETYDSLDTTDPTQTLRKPKTHDVGACTPGIPGLAGHCGSGAIRDYNFVAGLALLWLRGGE